MFYSLLFWLFVVGALAVSNSKPSEVYVSGFFDDRKFSEYMSRKNYTYAAFLLLESLREDAYGIEGSIDDFFKTMRKSSSRSDKMFSILCFPLLKSAYKKRKHISLYVNIITLWGLFSYASIQTIFVICLVSAIVSYSNFSKYVYYMDGLHIALFYIIPACIFLIIMFIGAYFFKKELDWPLVKVSFIITFFLSLPIEIFNNDWATAIEDYEQEMRDELGEDWEDEANSINNELIFRRR